MSSESGSMKTELERYESTLSKEVAAQNPEKNIEKGPDRTLAFHVNTLWLFTCNDLKSIVFPETAFGVFSALTGSLLTTNHDPHFSSILWRLPHILLWNWLNVLLFDVANQRLPGSILEDSINKAWRPMPTGRLSEIEARRLLLVVILVNFIAPLWLGGLEETVAMMALTWMYNDLGGANENFMIRNLINGFGFMCYSSGATLVACQGYSLNGKAYQWIAIIGAIVFSTLSMQDMSDQEGDRACGRRTAPLVFGDWVARWLIGVPVLAWSAICPAFWGLGVNGYLVPLSLGFLIGFRLLFFRSVASDKVTWKCWNIRIVSLYFLPLCKGHSFFSK